MAKDPVRELVAQRPLMFDLAPAKAGASFKVNDFITCSPGVSNTYLINTKDGDILINAGMGFEAPVHKAEYAPIRKGKLPYLILTQGHVDHVGGVSQMREPETKLIAQRNNQACQEDDRRIMAVRSVQSSVWFPMPTAVLREMQKTGKAPNGMVQDTPIPDILVDDRMDLELGGLKLDLLSVPGGETIDSLAIHLPQHNVLFTGNQLGPLFPHFPNLVTIRGDKYRFWEAYLASLRRIRALEPEILVTGHFQPIVGKELIRTCLDRLHDAVTYIHQTTLDGMNAGKDIFQLMREVTLPDELYVGQNYGLVSYCVRLVWEEYMGWFKGKATSQLLSVQPEHMYGEFVAMAGLDQVIARGRALLEAGETEKAVVLTEAALAADPANKDALNLSVAVHEALLRAPGGDNFWHSGWLKHQIAAAKTALG